MHFIHLFLLSSSSVPPKSLLKLVNGWIRIVIQRLPPTEHTSQWEPSMEYQAPDAHFLPQQSLYGQINDVVSRR